VQIPKGTKALGEEEPTLKEDFSFQFKTPIVKVRNSTEPSGCSRTVRSWR
jgi:hypothetical protein